MSERYKYAKNGICSFENFAEHLVAGEFPTIRLGRLCGMKWYFALTIEEDGKYICPAIWSNNHDSKVKHSVQVHFDLVNNSNGYFGFWSNRGNYKETERIVMASEDESSGVLTSVSKILNPKNGWLDVDGTLKFEYGIQVEAIMKNNIWTFNFNDKLFNAGVEMFTFKNAREVSRRAGYLYSHRQLLKYHSQVFEKKILPLRIYTVDSEMFNNLTMTLQIVHGVRLQLNVSDFIGVYSMAKAYEMSNVLHYCDWYLVTKNKRSHYEEEEKDWIISASMFGMRHFLVCLLKPMKSLKDCIDKENIEKISNESMKMFIAKFVYEKF